VQHSEYVVIVHLPYSCITKAYFDSIAMYMYSTRVEPLHLMYTKQPSYNIPFSMESSYCSKYLDNNHQGGIWIRLLYM